MPDHPDNDPSDDDPSTFELGLAVGVAQVLDDHGFPVDERALPELEHHLFHFLHGNGTRCHGGTR